MGPGPDRSSGAESWLPEDAGSGSASETTEGQSEDPSSGRQWLLDETGPRLSQGPDSSDSEPAQDATKSEARLKAAEEALSQRDIRISELEGRVAELESRIDELLAALADAMEGTTTGAERSENGETPEHEDLDLNTVSFEQLRDLGLSVTQSARLIGFRDARGGFDSMDELAGVPGLPIETRRILTDQLTLG
jgi:DNA uptake protein ComE-like DNA-binding protein